MTKAARTPPPGSSFELYARAMLEHWLGKKVTVEFERDDGYRSGSKIDSYFTPPSKWPRMEREAIRLVRGRVLDLGCGPGRHSLFLQRKGFDVVGVDASPTQVALARIRGLANVYPASVRRLPRGLGTFNSVLMLGNNLGLAGDVPHFRRFLRELRGITRKGGRLIGNSRIPGTWSEDHLPYVKWNVPRGLRPAELGPSLSRDADAPPERDHGEAGRVRRLRAEGRREHRGDRGPFRASLDRGQDARRAVHDRPQDHPRAGLDGTRIDSTTPHGVRAAGSRLPHGVRQGNRRRHASDRSDRSSARHDLVLKETGVR